MEKDIDKKLYNEYLCGKKEAFEILYIKYKKRLEYFVFNIVHDYSIAEDICQETFIYVMKNKIKEDITFKQSIFTIAKSRAVNYINVEKRRREILKENKLEDIEKDLLEIIEKEEIKIEVLDALNHINEKYRNAVYLVNIEGFSYKEVSEILGQTIQNTKNFVHRGKLELKKYLLKKGIDEMNKAFKIVLILLCISVLISGAVLGIKKIYNFSSGKANIIPSFTSNVSNVDENKVWVGTFNLVWNDLIDVIGGKIEFEDGYNEMADNLNKMSFTKDDICQEDVFKIHGKNTIKLKEKILEGIKNKFNEESDVLDKIDWDRQYSYILYAMLKKEFNYLVEFDKLKEEGFNNSEDKVKYFGIGYYPTKSAHENIDVLFYNSNKDFAVKLKTKENEDIILYKNEVNNKSFDEVYSEILEKENNYNGNKVFSGKDIIKIPYIKLNASINYDDVCGKVIKGTNMYIGQAIQTVNFELNATGGNVKSEATIENLYLGIPKKERIFSFNETFFVFLKESDKSKPYFALKVDNIDVLVLAD